jgi:hypothetical protein
MAFSCAHAQGKAVSTWPTITPFDHTFLFASDDPHIDAMIVSTNNKPLYRFVCHEGDYEDNETGDYNMLFQCKLFSLTDKKSGYLDLFLPSYTWRRSRTRAEFNSGLDGKCFSHPYYGHERTFMLRGMHIVLTASDFTETPSTAESLKRDLIKPEHYALHLRVRFTPTPTAKNAIAGTAPEVCESSYELDKSGKVIETMQLYPDPASE